MRPSLLRKILESASLRQRTTRGFLSAQRRALRNDVLAVKGLMPLVMKVRNGGRWTVEERELLRACLKRLSVASPYLVVLVMPGGLLLLPFIAWWLERRRNRSRGADVAERAAP